MKRKPKYQLPKIVFSATIIVYHNHKLTVKFRLLQNFDFPDVNVMQRIDALASLFNILGNRIGNEFVYKLSKVRGRHFTGHDIDHFPPDVTNLQEKATFGLIGLNMGYGFKSRSGRTRDFLVNWHTL